MVPVWAVICTVLIVVLLTVSIFLFIFKKKTSRAIIQPQDDAATLQGSIHEKNKHMSMSIPDTCYFADKMEIESSDDPYYKHAGGFVSIDLDNIKKEEDSNEINYTSLPNASTSTIVTAIEEGQAVDAARQVIRSASRKSRTRSMVITDESSTFTEKVPDISTYATVRRPSHFKILKDANDSQTISKPTPYNKGKTLPRKNQLQHLFDDSPALNDDPESNNRTIRTSKMPNRNVDTIRRMLQSSWSGHNLKSSESSSTLSSGISSIRPIASPVGSINPRLQNQQFVSLSLKANQAQRRQRPTIIGYMDEPKPTASFCSSTVQTVIPADEV